MLLEQWHCGGLTLYLVYREVNGKRESSRDRDMDRRDRDRKRDRADREERMPGERDRDDSSRYVRFILLQAHGLSWEQQGAHVARDERLVCFPCVLPPTVPASV